MVETIIKAITKDGKVTDRELLLALLAIGAYLYVNSKE
jgi:hypothetical protein